MIADLHAHYPMRVINDMDPETTARLMKTPGPTIRDRIQALVLKIANRLGNYPTWDGTYRVTPETLREGGVGLAMSVLLGPFDEMDLDTHYAAAPEAGHTLAGPFMGTQFGVSCRCAGLDCRRGARPLAFGGWHDRRDA